MAWCLSFHAAYGCRHAGACCSAEWPIPFEDGTIAARNLDGTCTFLDGHTGLCHLHTTGGQPALPLTCRMFPRVVLHDPRGTFISLSHFCPTAASLLFEPGPRVAIVDAPATLTHGDETSLDGLDARSVWPPLLRPGVLMDLESYGAWERRAIDVLTETPGSADDALTALERATQQIIDWSPGSGALSGRIDAAFGTTEVVPYNQDVGHGFSRAAEGFSAMPVKRWLAARLFGTWTAYQKDGLAATVQYLRSCHDTFTTELATDGNALEAIRRSDLRILHHP